MDAIMTFLLEATLLAILIIFFALMTLAAYALLWSIYRMAHDHWTPRQVWNHARHHLHSHAR